MKRIGTTLMEVVIATVVLGTVMMGFAVFQAATVQTNQKERDRAFALQKATQIMEELKAFSAADGAAQLDNYGQSESTYSFNLTIENVPAPSDAISDNTIASKGYRYVRQILVKPLPRDKGARQVTVRILLSNGSNVATPKAGAKPLASVANVFKSMPTVVLPSQAYEVYRIAMWEFANATGDHNSYQYPTLYTSYGARGSDYLQNANTGLDMTIRRQVSIAAYGRDTYYAPLYNDDDYWAHINSGYSAGSDVQSPDKVPFNHVYFRPGMYSSDQGKRLDIGYGQSRYWRSTDGVQAYEPTTPTPKRGSTDIQVVHTNSEDGLYENQRPYTFADQYNHALRYVEHYEKALKRTAYSQAALKAPELTLRTLLDDLIAGKLKNAMIVNDHAEVFPMIPLRNYSDAAKVPAQDWDLANLATMWGVTPASALEARNGAEARLVTHPYKLEQSTNDVIEMRVFPYKASDVEEEPPTPYRQGQIVLRNLAPDLNNWNTSGGPAEDVEIQALVRVKHKRRLLSDDVNAWWFNYFDDDMAMVKTTVTSSDMHAYRWVRVWPPAGTLRGTDGTGPLARTVPYVPEVRNAVLDGNVTVVTTPDANGLQTGDVVIKLKDIPYTMDYFKAWEKTNPGNGVGAWEEVHYGVDKDTRLHGMNYFPDPLMPDLTKWYHGSNDDDDDDYDKLPRNSARFRILFKSDTARVVEALTTIGADANLYNHQAPNRSRTWTWVKSPGGATTVPDTEQFQLVGDPRHNPYRDVRDSKRYNRYFGDLDDAYFEEDGDTDWNRFADTAAGWGPSKDGVGRADYDIPRYFELWRRGLLNSNAMFGTITANAFKYVVLGSEYNDVPHSKYPMTGEKNKKQSYDERDNPTLVATKDKKWYAKPWLGELYPDDRWADWINGNLPSDDFRRLEVQNIDNFPSEVKFKRTRTVNDWGPLSFYNSQNQFGYRDAVGKGKLTSDSGRAVTADMKGLLRETVDVKRSFTWNDTPGTLPPDWNSGETQAARTTIEPGVVTGSSSYYKADDGNHAVAPFVMRRDDKAAYFLAFTPFSAWGGANDPMSMQRVFMASLMQGYLDMASPTYKAGGNKGAQRIRLLPRVKVTAPEDDASVSGTGVTIQWEPEWKRWDGQEYSRQFDSYGATSDKPQLAYFVKYSENGTSWVYANTSPAVGTWVGVHARYNTVTQPYATTAQSLTLDISKFKNKQYQVRVEAWRRDPGYQSVHHAYAQISINVNK